ncbi:hypothetical protein MWMV18_MWMV18_03223 [Acinetobacter calcoaceticus]|nr:hypothetical protein MWMV18_MWMV18_03223 [Acinetobacter calcoaceticus]
MSTNNQNQQDKKEKWIILLFIIVIVFIWIIFPWCLSYLTDKFEWNIRNDGDANFGTFGDTFGALNTLFSGLAFATLIITLILQRKELQLQRKAVQDQQLEIQRSNDIADQQRIIANQQAVLIEQQIIDSKIQSFYQLLFKYIDEKNRKINALTTYNENGMNVINDFCNKFEQEFAYSTSHEYLSKLDDETLRNHINEVLYSVHSHTENQLSLIEYDEYLNFILNFIETHKNLEVTENAILTFISYQNINEMKCMAYLAIENEELFNFIHKYSLLRKLNTFEEHNDFFLNLVWRLYGEVAFTP